MPATCDHCGRTTHVYACPECLKRLRAEAKPRRLGGARKCQPCKAQWRGKEWHLPYTYCAECLPARGYKIEERQPGQ